MTNESTNMAELKFCPVCDKHVTVVDRALGVKLCPNCNKILASDRPMEKGGM